MKMNIRQSALKARTRIKNQPSFLFYLFLNVLAIAIYFPKYLYHLIKKQKIVAFDWADGLYSDFYMPLLEKLHNCNLEIIFFFCFGSANNYSKQIFEKGLPRFYERFLDNKIVISATTSAYKKLPKTVRVQIFHGTGSFGVGKQRNFIDLFDVLFLMTKFQWLQCTQGKYKKIAEGKKIFKVGWPKLDKYISLWEKRENHTDNKITLFYGPTYHCDISSIFEFLDEIVQTCQKNSYKLIVKLHPFLYYKRNYDYSGGIDWVKRIYAYKKSYNDIILLKSNESNLGKYFIMSNIFLTDVSNLGFEFVLSTSKPIIFLGTKLKIPLQDLRKGDIRKYKNYPEIYYRGRIGPIVKQPMQFEETVKAVIEEDYYKTAIEEFRREYLFNLGNATGAAVSLIKDMCKEL